MSTSPDPEARRRIVNRLRRASGQLTALIAAVENDAPCRDVVTQLSAVSAALSRAGFQIVATAMHDCIAEEDTAARSTEIGPDGQTPADQRLTSAELERLFMMLA